MTTGIHINIGKPSIIGYAQADFKTLITDKNLYIDRTAYIHAIENHSNRNLLFVRPRRFGKSLWISILHYYYGVEHKDKFDKLFANTAIGQNPTSSHNTYLILKMQFAGIDIETDASTLYGFRLNVLTGVQTCMGTYSAYFSKDEISWICTHANLDTRQHIEPKAIKR